MNSKLGTPACVALLTILLIYLIPLASTEPVAQDEETFDGDRVPAEQQKKWTRSARSLMPQALPPSAAVLGGAAGRDALTPLPLRLDVIDLSEMDARIVHEAEQQLIATCMSTRGFPYERATFRMPRRATRDRIVARDPEEARARGYGIAQAYEDRLNDGDDEPDGHQMDSSQYQRDADRAHRALVGEPPTLSGDRNFGRAASPDGRGVLMWDRRSCIAEAKEELYGDYTAAAETRLAIEELIAAANRKTRTAPAMQHALENWKSCVHAAGLPYDDPGEVARELSKTFRELDLPLEAMRAQEVETAMIDAQCQMESELAETARKTLDAQRDRAAEQNHALLASAAAQVQELLSRTRFMVATQQ